MEIRGEVHEIGETQNATETFKKRDLIVSYAENPQFVEYIRFEATQDRVSLFDNLAVGDEVEVSFNLRGHPWTNRESNQLLQLVGRLACNQSGQYCWSGSAASCC